MAEIAEKAAAAAAADAAEADEAVAEDEGIANGWLIGPGEDLVEIADSRTMCRIFAGKDRRISGIVQLVYEPLPDGRMYIAHRWLVMVDGQRRHGGDVPRSRSSHAVVIGTCRAHVRIESLKSQSPPAAP